MRWLPGSYKAFQHDNADGVVEFFPTLHEAKKAGALAARGGERLGVELGVRVAIAQVFRRQALRELEAEELLGFRVEARALAVDLCMRGERVPCP